MRRTCLILMLLLAALVIQPAWAATPLPDVKIVEAAGGGYQVTTPIYAARIGADGNLHSLTVNGVEFLDDRIAGSAGAAFFVERPLALTKLTLDERAIIATDGVYRIRYDFDEGYLTLALLQSSPRNAAYTAVCAQQVAYVANLTNAGLAAAPATYDWADVSMIMPTGEYLELRGGSRIWGPALGRQVWERGGIAPNKECSLLFVAGRGEPRTPSLTQLTTLSVAFDNPDQLLPAGGPVTAKILFQNNANVPITTSLALRAVASDGRVVGQERKPVSCPAHQLATVPWTLTLPGPDFYTLTVTADLSGTSKTYATAFGSDAEHIAPAIAKPADFADYWTRLQAEAKAGEVKLTRLEDRARSTSTVTLYRIGMEVEGASCFGWLAVPKFPGRYPGLLLLPGERVRQIPPNAALADCGFVVMTIEPTGQAIDGTVKPLLTQAFTNLHDPATVGLRGMMINYLRALQALATVPEVDPNRLCTSGVSLGGAIALMLSALDPRVQAAAPDVPYFCYIEQGKDAPGWPYGEVAEYLRTHAEQKDGVWNTLRYYDLGNFVDRLDCPVLISAGITDTISRPATIYGLYNRLPGPHAMRLYLAGHEGGGGVHWAEKVKWLGQVLGGPSPAAPAPPAVPAPAAPAPAPERP